jgi:hypothetical protein
MSSLLRILGRRVLLAAACCAATAGCQTAHKGNNTHSAGSGTDGQYAAVNVNFLLSMTWNEATKLSAQHLEIPPYYKVAADEIKVLKSDGAGHPLKVRAKGHVFMQVDFNEQLKSLGQEAYIESGGELILRGKPLLKRGRSLVEGLTDTTVFYIKGTRLQVIGLHRLTRQNDSGVFELPAWSHSWKEGPNPLLPALSPQDVPKGLRLNPLLPPAGTDDAPKGAPKE